MDLEALKGAGLYDPSDEGAAERVELLEYLLKEGCTVEEMQAAHARGRLYALAGDRRIRPLLGLLTLREAGIRLETDPHLLARVWRTVGLPDGGLDAPLLTEDDVEALQTCLLVSGFLGEDTALGVTRVVGVALARITEAVGAAMRLGMSSIDIAISGLGRPRLRPGPGAGRRLLRYAGEPRLAAGCCRGPRRGARRPTARRHARPGLARGAVRAGAAARLPRPGHAVPAQVVSGRVTRNVAPPPGVSSTTTDPACATTSACTMDSPSPLPPEDRVREASAR